MIPRYWRTNLLRLSRLPILVQLLKHYYKCGVLCSESQQKIVGLVICTQSDTASKDAQRRYYDSLPSVSLVSAVLADEGRP